MENVIEFTLDELDSLSYLAELARWAESDRCGNSKCPLCGGYEDRGHSAECEYEKLEKKLEEALEIFGHNDQVLLISDSQDSAEGGKEAFEDLWKRGDLEGLCRALIRRGYGLSSADKEAA